jgi:hypothetical protein
MAAAGAGSDSDAGASALERFLQRLGPELDAKAKVDKICVMVSQVWRERMPMTAQQTIPYRRFSSAHGDLTEGQHHAVRIMAEQMVSGEIVSTRPLGLDCGDGTTTLTSLFADTLARLDPKLKVLLLGVAYYNDTVTNPFSVTPDCKFDVVLIDGWPADCMSTTEVVNLEQAIHVNRALCLQLPGRLMPWARSWSHGLREDFRMAWERRNMLWLLRELRRNSVAFTPDIARDALWMLFNNLPDITAETLPRVFVSLLLRRVPTGELMKPRNHVFIDGVAHSHVIGMGQALAIAHGIEPPPCPVPCTLLHGVLTACNEQMVDAPLAGVPTIMQSLADHCLPDSNGLVLSAACPTCGTTAPSTAGSGWQPLITNLRAYIENQTKNAEQVLCDIIPPRPLRNMIYSFLAYSIV